MSAFVALVRIEIAHLVRSRVLQVGATAVVLFRLVTTWREMPVWYSALPDTSVSALAIGSVLMIVTGSAVLRERDPDVADFFTSLPTGRDTRTAALLCASLLTAAAVTTMALTVQLTALAVGSVPVGRFGLAEPLTGLATALLLGAAGVALPRWFPSPVTVPLTVAVVFWTLLQFPDSWLLPVVPDQHLAVAPPRPPTTHLLYVLALAAAVAALALVRGSLRWVPVVAVAVVASVVTATLALGSPQAHAYAALGDPRRPRTEAATAASTACRVQDDVRYCALPAFRPWLPLWAAAVRPVVAAVPPDVRAGLPDVVQELPVGAVDTAAAAHTAYVPVRWGRNGGESDYRRDLAGQVAALAVGLPSAKATDGILGCRGDGQARVVVALWLVGLVEPPELPRTEQEYIVDDSGRGSQQPVTTSELGAVSYGQAELDLVARLAEDPRAADRIRDNWATLTDPTTSVRRAATLLGVAGATRASSAESSVSSDREVCS